MTVMNREVLACESQKQLQNDLPGVECNAQIQSKLLLMRKIKFTIDGAFLDSCELWLFSIRFTKTVQEEVEWKLQQKEFSKLMKK
jgi:hypothetical protein